MNSTSIAETFLPTRFPQRLKFARLHLEFENGPKKMSPDEFWDFCADNRKIRAELTKEGEVIIMPPTGFETGSKNAEIIAQLRSWAKKDKNGTATDSNAGFILPNGATYAPDAAWTSNRRLDEFTDDEKQKFLQLCPDFVLELRSASDTLNALKKKMREYIDNGARLGWLIDPKEQKVHIYKPYEKVKILDDPKTVSGEGILTGFELDMTEIW